MGGALGDKVNDLANKFNASQKDYKVVPTFKGTYPESMTAAIAAYRAGNCLATSMWLKSVRELACAIVSFINTNLATAPTISHADAILAHKFPTSGSGGAFRKASSALAKSSIDEYRFSSSFAIAFMQIDSRTGWTPGWMDEGEGVGAMRIIARTQATGPSNGRRPEISS